MRVRLLRYVACSPCEASSCTKQQEETCSGVRRVGLGVAIWDLWSRNGRPGLAMVCVRSWLICATLQMPRICLQASHTKNWHDGVSAASSYRACLSPRIHQYVHRTQHPLPFPSRVYMLCTRRTHFAAHTLGRALHYAYLSSPSCFHVFPLSSPLPPPPRSLFPQIATSARLHHISGACTAVPALLEVYRLGLASPRG